MTQIHEFLNQGLSRSIPIQANHTVLATFVIEQRLDQVLSEVQKREMSHAVVDATHVALGAFLGYLGCLAWVLIPKPCGC